MQKSFVTLLMGNQNLCLEEKMKEMEIWHHALQHKDTNYKYTQHNNTQHNDIHPMWHLT